MWGKIQQGGGKKEEKFKENVKQGKDKGKIMLKG
jgi:hypothetical protein